MRFDDVRTLIAAFLLLLHSGAIAQAQRMALVPTKTMQVIFKIPPMRPPAEVVEFGRLGKLAEASHDSVSVFSLWGQSFGKSWDDWWAPHHLSGLGYEGPEAVKEFQGDFGFARTGSLDERSENLLKSLARWRKSLRDWSGTIPQAQRGSALIMRTDVGESGSYVLLPDAGALYKTDRIGELATHWANMRAVGSETIPMLVLANFGERAAPFAASLMKASDRNGSGSRVEGFIDFDFLNGQVDGNVRAFQNMSITEIDVVSDAAVPDPDGSYGNPWHARVLRLFVGTGSFLVRVVGSSMDAVLRVCSTLMAIVSNTPSSQTRGPTVSELMTRVGRDANDQGQGHEVAILYGFLGDRYTSDLGHPDETIAAR